MRPGDWAMRILGGLALPVALVLLLVPLRTLAPVPFPARAGAPSAGAPEPWCSGDVAGPCLRL